MGSRRGNFAPNWFVGVPVPAEAWFERFVVSPPSSVRRFHPDDLHMTVAFLGSVEEEKARAGWEALEWPIGPVEASLGSVVPMGSPRRYSALSIVVENARREIEAAIECTRDAVCDAAQARREGRPPKAHITVARPFRRASDAEREGALVWAKRIDLRGQTVRLDSVALYTWADDRRERQFKVVERLWMGE